MKTLARAAAILLVVTGVACGSGWQTDFEKARREAAAADKDLLVYFTGSDWCGFCIQLDEDVFSTEAFQREAPKKFIPVKLDFPKGRSALDAATIARNAAHARTYRVQGYPTIILMDKDGRPYARSGYRPGGVEQYLVHLKELHALRVARDQHLAEAAKLTGVEKARALAKALAPLPAGDVEQFYGDLVDVVREADPDDAAGVQKAWRYREARRALTRQVAELLGAGDVDAADDALEAFLAEYKPEGQARQEILMEMVHVEMERGNAKAALVQLDEIKKIAPDSEIGREVADFKAEITAYLQQQESAEEGSSE
jgi:thioredoxin-related protein